MRTSTPTPWYRRAPISSALAALLIALVALTATSAVYAVAYVDPTPPGGSTLPDAIYGYPYPPSGGPIRLVATGTNTGTQFFIVDPPPVGDPPYNPPLGTRLPTGIQIIRFNQNEARIATPPGVTVTEPATDNPNGITFAVGVTGNANEPPESGTNAARGYRIRVQRAPLTVTPVNASRRYGAPNPTFTFNVDGLRNGDTIPQVFQGALATTATGTSPVGTYQITQGALALTPYGAARYTFNFVPGTLTVTRAPLTITANDATRRVGAPNPTFSARYSGFVNDDGPADLGGELRFSTPATSASPAGPYPITPSGLTSNNYAITFVDGTLTLVERDLPEITWPNPEEITYGMALGSAHLNATASFNGQAVPGTFTYTPALGTVLPAGAAQDLQVVFTPNDSTNFAPVTVNRTIRVNRAPLTIRANDITRPVGAPNPTFSATFSGFVNGDDPADLTGELNFTTDATASSPVGAYPVIPSGVSSPNYDITYVQGTLTVTNARVYLPLVQN